MARPSLDDISTRHIRVLLVCHESVVRAALRALLDAQFGMEVIGEIDDLRGALNTITAECPDVTVVDPDRYALDDVTELLRGGAPSTRVILLTGTPASIPLASALENGAAGLVLKQQPAEVLIKAIDKVFGGELWLDRSASARLIAELSRAGHVEQADPAGARGLLLTRRERQVIALVGEGLRNSQIANRLHISEVTVRNHLTSTFRKLELDNRFQLVIYAFQHGLAKLPSRVNAAAALPDRVLEYQKKSS